MESPIKELYMYVFSVKFYHGTQKLNEEMKSFSDTGNFLGLHLTHIKLYKSLRADCDIIGWSSADSPVNIQELIERVKMTVGNNGTINHSFFSIYQRSPYLKNSMNIEKQIKESKKKYIVAYPMSKSNEWYLESYDERKRIMDEHIKAAMTDPNNRDILSYTTYSFGLGDQEFVVIYETDSLYDWMKVTEKLREVQARKWIVKESPILVGIRIE